MPEKSERCYCEHCVFCGKVRGAMRRGDKKEMRATLRILLDRYEECGEEIGALKAMLASLINGDTDESEEKKETIQ
jgi:hypothetical protein